MAIRKKTIEKYQHFLLELVKNADSQNMITDIYGLAKSFGVNTYACAALVKLGYVERKPEYKKSVKLLLLKPEFKHARLLLEKIDENRNKNTKANDSKSSAKSKSKSKEVKNKEFVILWGLISIRW